MDISLLLGISGIAITIVLAIIGFFLSNKTIGSIHTKLDTHDKLITLVQDAQSDVKEIAITSMQKEDKVDRNTQNQTGGRSKEEEEMNEALRQMRHKLHYPTSVLSKRKKVRK